MNEGETAALAVIVLLALWVTHPEWFCRIWIATIALYCVATPIAFALGIQ